MPRIRKRAWQGDTQGRPNVSTVPSSADSPAGSPFLVLLADPVPDRTAELQSEIDASLRKKAAGNGDDAADRDHPCEVHGVESEDALWRAIEVGAWPQAIVFRAPEPAMVHGPPGEPDIPDPRQSPAVFFTRLHTVAAQRSLPAVIVYADKLDVDRSLQWSRAGAFHVFCQPAKSLRMKEVRKVVQDAVRETLVTDEDLKRELRPDFFGCSEALIHAINQAYAAQKAGSRAILLVGESGVGKTFFANRLHRYGTRADKPFVALNCGAFSDTLLQSELFGHAAGVATDIKTARTGYLEQARGGTLFLDEIENLSARAQALLLTAVEEGRFHTLDGREITGLDFQVVAATWLEPEQLRDRGFLEPLLHRLSRTVVQIPPLRERAEDLERLAYQFLWKHSQSAGKRFLEFSANTKRLLLGYPWPGNVRELSSVLEHVVQTRRGAVVYSDMLPEKLRRRVGPEQTGDIATLVHRTLKTLSGRHGKKVIGVSQAVLGSLAAYAWPGQVRELELVIERAYLLAKGDTLELSDLPAEFRGGGDGAAWEPVDPTLEAGREAADRCSIERALRQSRGEVKLASEILGIQRATLQRMIKALDIYELKERIRRGEA